MPRRPLEDARQQLGLSYTELWIDFFALGGNFDAGQLAACLRGDRPLSDSDHNIVTHALNERFRDRGENNPLPYNPR